MRRPRASLGLLVTCCLLDVGRRSAAHLGSRATARSCSVGLGTWHPSRGGLSTSDGVGQTRLFARRTPKKPSPRKKHNSGGLTDGSDESAGGPLEAAAQEAAEPRRLSREGALSLRQQLSQLKHQRRQEKVAAVRAAGGGMGSASKYRKSKDDEDAAAAEENDKEASGFKAFGTQVFVDGFNVMNAWPKLKKRLTRNEVPLARSMLEQDMDALAVMKGWNVKIVYDSAGYQGEDSGAKIASYDTTAPTRAYGTGAEALFVGRNETADTFIERHVAFLKSQRVPMVIVATDDTVVRSVVSSSGGMYMSCSKLLSQVKESSKATEVHIARARPIVPGHFRVQDMLSEEERQMLEDTVHQWNVERRHKQEAPRKSDDESSSPFPGKAASP